MVDGPSSSIDAHARHDPLRIAALLDRGDASADVRSVARACGACGALLDDMGAITAALPGIVSPARARDFRLTAEQAARLRRRGLAALIGRIGTARDAVTRPLAVGFTTLGLAGFLVAAAPAGFSAAGGAAASIVPEAAPDMAPRAAASALAAPALVDDVHATAGQGPADGNGAPALPMAITPTPTGPTPLQVASGSFLGLGGALFGLRRVAARQRVR